MLRLSQSLVNQPVISLRLGGRIATALQPIINPHNLKILGWWCKVPGHSQNMVLLAEDMREILPDGIAINDDDSLSLPEDLVRHKEVLDINFQLLEKPVRTKRHRLGRVEDYSYNDGMFVQKLYVGRPLVKVLTTEPTLIVDRSQIIEVTDTHIVVKDVDLKVGAEEFATALA
jgi:hypothetical protein